MKTKEEDRSISLSEVIKKFPEEKVLKNKRERKVYKSGQYYVKIWVPGWTQSKVTKAGFDLGFYDKNTCPAFHKFIQDDSGQRGYILKPGDCFRSNGREDWKDLCNKTSKEDRLSFMRILLENSLKSKGFHCDMFLPNLVLFESKLCLIDLDGFRSYSFLFEKKKSFFEEFELDAWWQPHKSACRDLDLSLRSYFKNCLDTKIEFKIDSEEKIRRLYEILKG